MTRRVSSSDYQRFAIFASPFFAVVVDVVVSARSGRAAALGSPVLVPAMSPLRVMLALEGDVDLLPAGDAGYSLDGAEVLTTRSSSHAAVARLLSSLLGLVD